MTIYVQTVEGTRTGPRIILGRDRSEVRTDAVPIFGLSVESSGLTQIIAKPRAESVETRDRGNASVAVTWSVARQHDSVQAAQLFAMDHPSEVPRRGRVTFVAEDGGRRYVEGGLVTVVFAGYSGVSTRWSYKVVGPPFVVVKDVEGEE